MPRKQEVLEGVIEEYVYECWISGGEEGTGGGFCKLPAEEVATWVNDQLSMMTLGQRLHIVQHLRSEYS